MAVHMFVSFTDGLCDEGPLRSVGRGGPPQGVPAASGLCPVIRVATLHA